MKIPMVLCSFQRTIYYFFPIKGAGGNTTESLRNKYNKRKKVLPPQS